MPLPAKPATALPDDQRYLLISDAHLGDGGRTDLFGGKDHAFLEMLSAQTGEVDAVILNGDILDAPQAGVADRIRSAHGRVLDDLDDLAERLPCYYVLGNHDTVEFVHELLPGWAQTTSVSLGDQVLVIHGHQLDKHFHDGTLSNGSFLALRAHARVEQLTGQLIRLPFGDHDNATNRFAHWVFYRYTMATHRLAQALAAVGREERLRRWAAHHDYWSRTQWGDSHALLIPALAALATSPHRLLVTGHSHQAGVLDQIGTPPSERVSGEPPVDWRPLDRRVPDPESLRDKTYANLGSWTFLEATYGRWEDQRLVVRDWRTGESVAQRTYEMALHAEEIPGMREWWRRYYKGLFHYDMTRVRRERARIQM